jgi:hypothetical protein
LPLDGAAIVSDGALHDRGSAILRKNSAPHGIPALNSRLSRLHIS